MAIDTVTVPDVPSELQRRIDDLVNGSSSPASLRELITLRAGDLIAYQDENYAKEYLAALDDAVTAERRATGVVGPLTEAVARNLHHLMAYKDEYEVARLLLLPEAQAGAHEVGGPNASISWKLHPPMLKALGMQSKLTIPARSAGMFRALAQGKRLRGTRLDPFGHTKMRRLERSLPKEYLTALAETYQRLTPERLEAVVAIAELPDHVRGYEDLKLRRAGEFRASLQSAVAAL